MSRLSASMSRRADLADARDAGLSRSLPAIAAFLLAVVLLAAIALTALPSLRAAAAAFGAAPLWLLAMPLASLAALAAAQRNDGPMPQLRSLDAPPVLRRPRSGTAGQARRRSSTVARAGRVRAA